MTDRELLQKALDALELTGVEYLTSQEIEHLDALEIALRARLAQPEPEPVAWWHDRGDVVDLNVSGHGTPLYFAPPKKEWVGLTDAEIMDACSSVWASHPIEVGRVVEAKLKEKNAC